MEDTDLFEWTRRPGFSKFCSVQLPSTEVVNQFDSYRNLNGQVVPLFDSSTRLATFTPTTVTTIVAKTTAAQGFSTTLGNMLYFADGAAADYFKYDQTNTTVWGLAAPTITPTATGLGFWQPAANFDVGDPIQDTNGNIEAVSAILIPSGSVGSPTAFQGNFPLAGGVGTWAGSVSAGGVVSETLTSAGYTKYLFFYDFNLAIPATATILGISATIFKQVVGGTAQDQSVQLVYGGVVIPGQVDHASATPWSTTAFVPITYGGPTDTWSAGLTATHASTQGLSGFGLAIAADVLTTTAFNLVQSGTSNTEVSNTTIYSFPNPVQAGNTLVIGVFLFHESFVSIADNLGNTYGSPVVTEIFGEHTMYTFVVSNAIAGATTITVITGSLNGNTFTGINAHEFHGILSASPVDASAANSSALTSPFNSGTVVVPNADDIVFSYNYNPLGGALPTPSGGYTAGTNTSFVGASNLQQLLTAFKAPGATGSVSPSWSSGSVGNTVVLKSAESATVEVGGGSSYAPIITIYYTLPTGVGPGFSGPVEPIWPTTLGGTVNDGGVAWTNYGPPEIWYPLTNYPVPVVVIDTNGNVQLATVTTNPVAPWDSGTGYAANVVVSYAGSYWINVLGSTNTGNTPSAFTTSSVTAGVTTYQTYWAPAANPITTGTIMPVWNTTLGGTTVDGNYIWTNLGQGSPLASFGYAYVYAFRTIYGHLTTASPYSNNTGAILGPLNGSIAEFKIVSGVTTFYGSNNFLPGNIFTVTGLAIGTYLNEQIFTVLTAIPSAIFPLTATKVTGSGLLLTVYALNNLLAGQTVTFSNVGTATWLNGLTLTVLSSPSSTSFTATVTLAESGGNYGQTSDTGNVLIDGSWTANAPAGAPANVSIQADAGVAAPLIATITGKGTNSPLCNSVATITAFSVTADIITIYAVNNFQPGLWVTLEGLSVATFLNGQQVQVIAVDQPIGTLNNWFQVYFITPNAVQTADAGTATFNAVEIYRTSDGGGTYLFDGAVTNPGANLPWTFDDFVTDADLDILLIAPQAHQNDPPPGAPGSIITKVGSLVVYWQGRIWMAVGNYVYFDAGPDCTNGIPEESWPPGNRFQFVGPVMNIIPTADGVGLLVFLADRVNAILGGPETISFYATDFLSNFGIANPNAIFRDGSVIGLFTTQKQYFELLGANKQEIGSHIADYLTANFTASQTYATMHRDGLDVGLFLSNGSNQILRSGINIENAWSVPAYPSFGAGALRSIETSVGIYSLMLATPAGGAQNYLYARDVNSWGDGGTYGANNGTPYAVCNITIGSITLSQPGARLFPLQHVVVYADAVGTLNNGGSSNPTIWVLPNEVAATTAVPFIQLTEVLQEPPVGQTRPSSSLLALRYPINGWNSSYASQFVHHIQVRVEFEPENAPNTLKAISFKESQDE